LRGEAKENHTTPTSW